VLCLLQAKFRGYFVPPRPEKNAVEGQRMSDGFVEERRASLQKYLQKLAAHPVIGPSEVRTHTFISGSQPLAAFALCLCRQRRAVNIQLPRPHALLLGAASEHVSVELSLPPTPSLGRVQGFWLLPPQELKVFLETSGELSSSMRWGGMMPASASVLEGTAKFSMQLIGRESKVRAACRQRVPEVFGAILAVMVHACAVMTGC
jgi:hypothetical protein